MQNGCKLFEVGSICLHQSTLESRADSLLVGYGLLHTVPSGSVKITMFAF